MDNSAVLGMETASAWSTTTVGAVLAQASTHSQGSYSLSVRPSNSDGFTPIKSMALTTLSTVSPTLAVDVMLPTFQPNPNWLGTAQAYIDCPSRNINSQFLGQVELTGKPLNVWNTINFPLTNVWVAGLLQAGYSDLRITVVLNVQVPTTGIYFVDNLRFTPVGANGCGGRPNGTSCTDGNACTQADTCQSGACHPGTAVSCQAIDQCHDPGVCDQSTGLCSNPAKDEGTICSDGDACTQSDTCKIGICVGSNPVSCVAIDQCHAAGTCNPATGACTNPKKGDGTGCNDGNACTQVDSCQDGACVGGSPVACPAPDQCHIGVCDPSSGSCGSVAAPEGTTCDDGNACTTDDACESGTCVGNGSGYVGPGEQCAPPTPTVPGPFGDFHCLLEETLGTGKNVLTLGAGGSAEAWTLRGTMDFSFTTNGAKLTKISATGQQSRLAQQNGILLVADQTSASSGSVDMTSGNVQVTLPVVVVRTSGGKMPVRLDLTGQVADRVLQGTLGASSGLPANGRVFCREQFKETVASATFQLDSDGAFVGQGPVGVLGGTPTMPSSRSIPGADDLVAELVSMTGEILDQYSIGKPWIRRGKVPAPSEITEVTIRAPLSNRLGGVILRTGAGDAVAMADLTQPVADFCSGTGSQYCDYKAGTPVRTVFYTVGKPAPPVSQDFASLALPSSPRVAGAEVVLTTDDDARQPDVALDADGNAIVVWRDDYSSIMAKGIAKDGSVLFGPTKINDTRCATGWIPKGYPPPKSTEETGDLGSQRPVIAVSNTSDRTFAVAWGAYLWLYYDGVPLPPHVPIICARLMRGDGTPINSPALVAPSLPGNDGSVLDQETYVDISMADSHEFLVAWSELPMGSNQHFKIAMRRFGSDGRHKTANAVVVSNDDSRDAVYPSVAMDKAGEAVVTWMSTTNPYPTDRKILGQVKMQRFNSDSTKRGDNQLVQTAELAGIPDVAFRPSGSSYLISARSSAGDIYAGAFQFSDGTKKGDWMRINSRTSGSQGRPVAIQAGDGGYMVAWLDEVGSGSSQFHPVSGQVFDASGVPIDVDFTISTQVPIDTQPTPENPDFYWIYDAFAFRAAASQKDFAVVWQRPTVNRGSPDDPQFEGGIVLQRLEGGPPDCPSANGCGPTVPLRVTGDTTDKIDVVLIPGRVVREDTGAVDEKYTKPYYNAGEFARTAIDMIVNGYLAENDVFPNHLDQFNFYYEMTQGDRTMHMVGGECEWLIGNVEGSQSKLEKNIGYTGNKSFANVGIVVFRDYSRCGISQEPQGISTARDLMSASEDVRTGEVRKMWVQKASDYSLFLHESGHTFFDLKGEYCGDDIAEDTRVHSNTFDRRANCVDKSVDPDRSTHCHVLCSTTESSTADSDDCPMGSGRGMKFGLDCQRRAECVVNDLLNPDVCP